MAAPDLTHLTEQRKALLHKLLAGKGVAAPGRAVIEPTPAGEAPQLSFAQERMWFFEQLVPGTAVYNLPAVIRMVGPLDRQALQSALGAALGRHDALHARFASDRGRPALRLAGQGSAPLTFHDLAGLQSDEAHRLVTAEVKAPFDLASGPLVRLMLLRVAEQEHILVLNMHHIAGDAWSWEIILRDTARVYAAGSTLPAAEPVQYQDFARWQRARYRDGELAEQLGYWRKQLDGAPAPLELPSDRVRPAAPRFQGAVTAFDVGPEHVAALREIGRREGATLFMVTLAAFNVLLHRYTGQSDIVIGTPAANREQAQIQPLVGLFVNTLLMRTRMRPEQTFLDLLRDLRRTATQAYANADIPFEKLVEELAPDRGFSSSPFFQVMFAYRAAPALQDLGPLRLEPVDVHNGTAKRDLTLQLVETGDGLHGQIEYDTDLFDAATVERLAGHYLRLIDTAGSAPDEPVATMPMLTVAEREALHGWSSGGPLHSEDALVHQRFSAQAGRTPDAVAVVAGPVTLTYAELDTASDRLAGALAALGVGPEDPVGIHLDRSADLVVAILGVLKAGGAYVPVDMDGPMERRRSILDDAGVAVVISRDAGPAGPWTTVDPLAAHQQVTPRVSVDPAAKAYVLYTSGSTGKPKGVIVEHRQLIGYLDAILERLDLREPMAYAMVQPLTVDSSVTALFPPLITGGVLHVIPRELSLDAAALADYCHTHAVDVLKIAPSHLSALQRSERFHQILPRRVLVIGGEASAWEWVQRLQQTNPRCRVFNHYGPTEATVGVTTFRVAEHLGTSLVVTPLGFPLPGTDTHVLDPRMQPLPVGVPGELFLGGVNIARGYGGQPALTARSFVPDPFAGAGQRLYRTGDIVRRLPNGAIEFLGRTDDQVKIRGYRVELGEIESVLKTHAGVADAVVVVRSDEGAEPRVVAYVVLTGAVDQVAVQAHAQAQLPKHMVPSSFVVLDALPLSPHGKVDRKALPAPTRPVPAVRPVAAPVTAMQHTIAAIWCDLLGTDQVGVDENFFEAGGHSLLLVRLHHELQEAAGSPFPLVELFNATTIAAQADLLSRSDPGGAARQRGLERGLERGVERGRKQSESMRRRGLPGDRPARASGESDA